MSDRGTRRITRTALAGLSALALAAPAQAAGAAAATITSCKLDSLTVAGKVAVTGSAARKVRGANLQLRLQALPLFGLPRAVAWRDLGKKTSGSGRQVFASLPADNWAGVLSWRFKKGRKTLMSGDERSQPVNVGGTKGKANCTLAEGAKPVDTTPPALYILPVDNGGWHRAPAPVQLIAQDDFSGVKSMRYSLDGGPLTEIRNGATFDIPGEGAHQVQWAATDVAGNTGSRTATVNVDAGPPTKPALSRPFSVTASTTPSFQWSASTDSGSGLKGYLLAIKRADGSLVALQPVDPALTTANSPTALNDGETYTATITAVDKTDVAWTIDSNPVTFRVDTKPEVASVSPADGTVLAGAAKGGNFVLTVDRPVDPASVPGNVVLTRHPESTSPGDPSYTVSCNSPCTTITVDPNASSLPEGRYTLTASGLKSEEGVVLQSFAARYAVAFFESGSMSVSSSNLACTPTTTTSAPSAVPVTDPNETGTLDFDWSSSGSGGWSIQAYSGATALGTPLQGNAGSGHGRLTYPLGGHGGSITFHLTAGCPGGASVSVSNMLASRVP
jgi:hypothetical protein